jgi:o-succinylbenzoate synthase
VTDLTVFAASLELRHAVAAADRTHATRTSLFVRLRDGEEEGWSECPVATSPGVDATADELLDGVAAIDDVGLAALVGHVAVDPDGELRRRSREPAAGPGHRSARAHVAAAALDLGLRRADRSLGDHLGVAVDDVGFAGVVGIDEPASAADRALELVALGASRLRVKIAPGSDLDALEGVLKAVDVPVVADANGSLDPDDRALLDALVALPLAWLEQPFAPDALQQTARLARSSPVRVGLDESVVSTDALRVISAAGAASVICVKPARLGLLGSLDVLRQCRELRLAAYVGGYFEAGLGRAVLGTLSVFADLDGDVVAPSTYLLDDPCELAGPTDGRQPLYCGPGLGPLPQASALSEVASRSL